MTGWATPKGDEQGATGPGQLVRATTRLGCHHQRTGTLAANQQLDARLATPGQRLRATPDEQPLQQLLQTAPSPEAARKTRQAMVDRAITATFSRRNAGCNRCRPPILLDPAQRQRLWELARQTGDSATVQRLSGELQRPCLETAEWLSCHDPHAALSQAKLPARRHPQTWLDSRPAPASYRTAAAPFAGAVGHATPRTPARRLAG